MPASSSQLNRLNQALIRWHRATDSRAAAQSAWLAHDKQHAASRARRHHLQRSASEPDANMGDAAAATHASVWNGVKEDYFWTRAVFNFNQLPPAAAMAAPSPSFSTRSRSNSLSMMVGLLGKGVAFALAFALLPTIGLMRRTADWLLSYSKRGVPDAPTSGNDVIDAQRRQALGEWIDRHRLVPEKPKDTTTPRQFAPSTHTARINSSRQWTHASPRLAENPLPGASILNCHEPQGVLVPALERHLNVEALNELLRPEMTKLHMANKPFVVPAHYEDANEPKAPLWHIKLQQVANPQSQTPCIEAQCWTILPEGKGPRAKRQPHEKPASLRVPIKLMAHLRFTALGSSVDADVEPLRFAVLHEANRPLWFPRRDDPWAS